MDNFLNYGDQLSAIINEQALSLYNQLDTLPLEQLDLPQSPKEYFIGRHHKRNFFSVQTAAELIYRSIKFKNKPINEIVIMDYGGGLGSLYLLAKMIGCKQVIYNDIREDMKEAAMIIANYLKIKVDYYIFGDYKETYEKLEQVGIKCDIIASRNVIEHIYDLSDYFKTTATYQPEALIYSSTTANYSNLFMRIRHFKIHKEHEYLYYNKRLGMIKKLLPDHLLHDLKLVATATRGLAMEDLHDALNTFKNQGVLPDPNKFYTNTCDPENGLWAENMIKKEDYKTILDKENYNLEIIPGFWDTHYQKSHMRFLGKAMNFIARIAGKQLGLKTTAFIYIIAYK